MNIAPVGADNKHLRLRIVKNNQTINCIGFGMGEFAEFIHQGDTVNIAFQMDINHYQGNETVQLILKDIKKEVSICPKQKSR